MYIQENESVKDLLHVVSTFHGISHTSSVCRLDIFVRQYNVLFILYNIILHVDRCYRQTSRGTCKTYCQVSMKSITTYHCGYWGHNLCQKYLLDI